MFKPDYRCTVLLLIWIWGIPGQAAELTLESTLTPAADVAPKQPKKPQQPYIKMKDQSMTIGKAVFLATIDLANRLGHTDFDLTEAAIVAWRDSSAGCPSAGESYLQVLTPGYLIVFTTGDEVFRYTGSQQSIPKWCPAATFQPPFSLES